MHGGTLQVPKAAAGVHGATGQTTESTTASTSVWLANPRPALRPVMVMDGQGCWRCFAGKLVIFLQPCSRSLRRGSGEGGGGPWLSAGARSRGMLGNTAFVDRSRATIVKGNQRRKRSMVLVDVRLLWILGAVAVGGVLYAGWVNLAGGDLDGSAKATADQEWRQQTVDPVDWNHEDVGVWAAGLGLARLAAALRRSGVDGQLLLTLTEADIRNDLGITNDLQVRKVLMALGKLRSGDRLPPSASKQGLLSSGLNSSAPTGPGVLASSPLAKRKGVGIAPAAPIAVKFKLYRIWQSMRNDHPFLELEFAADDSKSWDRSIAAIRKHVIAAEGHQVGRAVSAHGNTPRGERDVVQILLKQRNGVTVESPRQLPADTDKLFCLVGDELFFFPDDTIGEKFRVPLPTSQRSVQVEVCARHLACKLF